MKGYKFGVAWIADNDEPTSRDAEEIGGFISTLLLADLFEKPADTVAADILAHRIGQDQAKDGTAPVRRERKPSGMAGQPFSQVEALQYKRMHPVTADSLERWPANGVEPRHMREAIKRSHIPNVYKGTAYRYLAYLVVQAERTAAIGAALVAGEPIVAAERAAEAASAGKAE